MHVIVLVLLLEAVYDSITIILTVISDWQCFYMSSYMFNFFRKSFLINRVHALIRVDIVNVLHTCCVHDEISVSRLFIVVRNSPAAWWGCNCAWNRKKHEMPHSPEPHLQVVAVLATRADETCRCSDSRDINMSLKYFWFCRVCLLRVDAIDVIQKSSRKGP